MRHAAAPTPTHRRVWVLYGQQKRPVTRSQPAGELGGRYWNRTSDLLGVNEWQEGQSRSLVQVVGLSRSAEVGAGRRGCCTLLSPVTARAAELVGTRPAQRGLHQQHLTVRSST